MDLSVVFSSGVRVNPIRASKQDDVTQTPTSSTSIRNRIHYQHADLLNEVSTGSRRGTANRSSRWDVDHFVVFTHVYMNKNVLNSIKGSLSKEQHVDKYVLRGLLRTLLEKKLYFYLAIMFFHLQCCNKIRGHKY